MSDKPPREDEWEDDLQEDGPTVDVEANESGLSPNGPVPAGVSSLLSRMGGLMQDGKGEGTAASLSPKASPFKPAAAGAGSGAGGFSIKGSAGSSAATTGPAPPSEGQAEMKEDSASSQDAPKSDQAEQESGPSAATALLNASTEEVKVTLADQQADPNSPLYSAKTFEELGLHPNLLKGLYGMKFSKPSKIQEKALPLLLAQPATNMIGQSQSGTGKTAAFSLTMLSKIDYSVAKPQALCLAPSRELARQIESVIQQMGKFVPLKTFLAVKDGWNKGTRVDAHVVIGTPGTVMDMVSRRALDLSATRTFVLDEADEMVGQQSIGDQTMRIKRMLPPTTQLILFSATFPPQVVHFATKFAPNANQIRLKAEELSVEGIKQFYMDCKDEEAKYDVLVELYSLLVIGQSIIFCKTRDTADRIAARMTAEGHSVASLHGSKEAEDRDAIIDGFRDGKTKVLITTNVIARGIDISQVNMVVNYDTPTLPDGRADTATYLHRVGRTGRFGRKGVAILFVSDRRSWEEMTQIEKELGKKIVKISTDDFDAMEETLKAEMKK